MTQPPPPLSAHVLSYATPGAPLTGFGVWRQGSRVVATRDADLGDACVKCGAPAQGWRWNKKLYWHEPWLYVLIVFPGLLIYAIVALAVRKKADVRAGLCPLHRERRAAAIALTTMLVLVGLVALFAGLYIMVDRNGGTWGLLILLAGLIMFTAAVIISSTRGTVLRPKKIDAHYAWYAGAGDAFLQTLPLAP